MRHELRRRKLVVSGVESLTPHLRRIRFTSPALAEFRSPAPDDHIKLFFPQRQGEPTVEPVMRDFTPRAFDEAGKVLTIDFAPHGELLRRALTGFSPPAGDGFVWSAGEGALVREVRTFFMEERRHPAELLKAAAYWHRSAEEAHGSHAHRG